ncbi:unnamed protein product [Ceratitis capitata]|uniref:(Mediterranean fruit fly) hypothetical protein n=1 Tax=Ceratitis capitata TaxID=7213 RepID=A0A811V5W1_CERCA|nr:unnamed protein product [Ceratitis capitata]
MLEKNSTVKALNVITKLVDQGRGGRNILSPALIDMLITLERLSLLEIHLVSWDSSQVRKACPPTNIWFMTLLFFCVNLPAIPDADRDNLR